MNHQMNHPPTAPPPPPLRPLPGFGEHPQVQRQFERININATEPLHSMPRPPPQYHQQPIYRTIQPDNPTGRPAPKNETPLPLDSNGKVTPYYEGFTFARLDPEAGGKKTWSRAIKTAMPFAHEELAALVRRQQAKGVSVTKKYDELGPLRRAQVDRLVAEKNQGEKDHRLIWKLASVKSEERKKEIVSMQVIVKRILKPDVVQASTGNGKVKVMAGEIIDLGSAMGKPKTNFIPGPGLKLPSQLNGGQGAERIYHAQPGHPMMQPQGQQQQQQQRPMPMPQVVHPGGHPSGHPMPHPAAQQGMRPPMVEIISDRMQPSGQRPPVMHFQQGQGQPMPQGMPPHGMPAQGMPHQGMPPRAQPPLVEVVHDRMAPKAQGSPPMMHFQQAHGPPKMYHQQGHPFAPHQAPKSPKKSHANPKASGKPHKRVEEWRDTVVDISDESESDAEKSIFSQSDSSDNYTALTPESSHREREKPKEKPRRGSAAKDHRKRDSHSHSHRSRETQGPVYREHRRRSPVPSLSPKERKQGYDSGEYVLVPARTFREGSSNLKRLNTTRGERPAIHRRGESSQDYDHHRDLSNIPYRSEQIEEKEIALERVLERHRDMERGIERGREQERERQKDLERERQRNREREREMERERQKEERETERERERERERARLDDLLYRREHERAGFADRLRIRDLGMGRDLGIGFRDRY